MSAPIAATTGPPDDRALFGITDPAAFRRGGIGIVYEAELLADRHGFSAGTKVGLKLLTGIDQDRFSKLSQRSAVLREHPHPYLARIIDTFVGPPLSDEVLGEEDATLFFAAHAWVEGVPLAARIETASYEEILAWMADIAEAVDHLHGLPGGFAHRDIHARNIIVRPDGRAVLIDFDTILWGEGHDTILTSLSSIPRVLQMADPSAGQADDRSMVALALLRALAGDADARLALDELSRTIVTRLGAEPDVGTARAAAVAGLLLRAIRQPPTHAAKLIDAVTVGIGRRPRRRNRRDPDQELARLLPAGARPQKVRRPLVWVAAVVVLIVGSATGWQLLRPTSSTPDVVHVVQPAFQCWDRTHVMKIAQCPAPSGRAGLQWAFAGAVELRNQSCSPQVGLDFEFCSFGEIGIDPVAGVYAGPNTNIGQGIGFSGPDDAGNATTGSLADQRCSFECRPWTVDGQTAGRIEIERGSTPNAHTWAVADGPPDLMKITIAYQHYAIAVSYYATNIASIDPLLRELRPRPPSQMRGIPSPGPDAYPCWNGTSAVSVSSCPTISGSSGLAWSLPTLADKIAGACPGQGLPSDPCENVSNALGFQLWFQPTDIGFTGAAADDIRSVAASSGDPRLVIEVGIWGTPDSGQSQIVTAAGATVTREPWMIDGKTVGELVWTSPRPRSSSWASGLYTLDAGYAHTPVWIRAYAHHKESLQALLHFLRPQAALTARG